MPVFTTCMRAPSPLSAARKSSSTMLNQGRSQKVSAVITTAHPVNRTLHAHARRPERARASVSTRAAPSRSQGAAFSTNPSPGAMSVAAPMI